MIALILAIALASADVRVIDGDTLEARGVRYRVLGLDAPELHGRCLAERQCSP